MLDQFILEADQTGSEIDVASALPRLGVVFFPASFLQAEQLPVRAGEVAHHARLLRVVLVGDLLQLRLPPLELHVRVEMQHQVVALNDNLED